MQYLPKILSELKITNRVDLIKYIHGAQHHESLKIINKSIIIRQKKYTYDAEEGRIHEDKIEFENAIIDLPKLNFRDSQSISFIDCIFLGDITIGASDMDSILIDECIFLNKLSLGMAGQKEDVCIYKSNFQELYISGLEADSLSLADSKIENLTIEDSKLKSFRAVDNKIEHINVGSSMFESIYFPHTQISQRGFVGLNRIKLFSADLCSYVTNRKQSSYLNLFQFRDHNLDQHIKELKFQREKETLDFLIKHTEIKNNRNRYSETLLNSSIFEQNDIFAKIFIYVFGAFTNPRLIFLHSIFAFVFFAFLYHMPFSEFVVSGEITNISITKSLYYSALSFTTSSDINISPFGIAKALSLFENITGVLLISSFLVSLVRKYCE